MWNQFDKKIRNMEQDFYETTTKPIQSLVIKNTSYKIYRSDPFITANDNQNCLQNLKTISKEPIITKPELTHLNSTFMTYVPENSPYLKTTTLKLRTNIKPTTGSQIPPESFSTHQISSTLIKEIIQNQQFSYKRKRIIRNFSPDNQFSQVKFDVKQKINYPSSESKQPPRQQPASPLRYPYDPRKLLKIK